MNQNIIDNRLCATSQSWDGAKLPHYPAGEPEIVIKKITIPAGARLQLHKHPVINAGYVIQGTLKVICTTNESRIFHQGDCIVEVVEKAHYGENIGSDNVELIMFYASTPGTSLSEQE